MKFRNYRDSYQDRPEWTIYWNWTFQQNMAWQNGQHENETRLSSFYMTNSRGDAVYLPTWMRAE